MRTLVSRVLFSAAILAAGVPASASQSASAHLRMRKVVATETASAIPIHLLPSGSGFGAGTWRLPATGGRGVASAELFDPSGRLRYVVRANLLRSGEIPPQGMPDAGGFYGVLLAVVGPGVREPVAQIEGSWIRQASGAGAFAASILVPTEDLDHPLVAIGIIEGTLRAPMAVSQHLQLRRGPSQGASTLGRLSLNWTVGGGD